MITDNETATDGVSDSPEDPQGDPYEHTFNVADGPSEGADGDPEMFPRIYVEKLRTEAAEGRVKSKRADQLLEQILDLTVRTTLNGVFVDTSDLLDFTDPKTLLDEDGLPDADLIRAAAEALIEAKPHLSVRPRGDIDQGSIGGALRAPIDLAGTLRRLAG